MEIAIDVMQWLVVGEVVIVWHWWKRGRYERRRL